MSKPKVFKSAHMEKQRGEGGYRGKMVVFQVLLVQSDGAVPAEAQISVNGKNSVKK